jgi:hypothetical protein
MRKQAPQPAKGQSSQKKKQRCRIPLFDAVHLRQDIGCGDCQKRPCRNADGEGNVFLVPY